MTRLVGCTAALLLLLPVAFQAQQDKKTIHLPSSKLLLVPAPGEPRRVGSFVSSVALSPDGRYLAILENGYGSAETGLLEGIAVLDLATNQVTEFPEPRLGKNARQTYFLGLACSHDGRRLYASMASISDPEGQQPGSTGNGIAVYSFVDGKVAPLRFLPIPPQPLAAGKRRGRIHRLAPPGTLAPYPAGLAVLATEDGEQLLVADNLSDDVLLLDVESGEIVRRFDLSTAPYVPAAFPYAVVASRDGARAWVSLWNASRVAELDLRSGKVRRWIRLREPKSATAAGSHPTALLLSPREDILFVALANTDEVGVVSTLTSKVMGYLNTGLPGQQYRGTYPNALAGNADGTRLFVANASSDAVAVFDISRLGPASGGPVGQPDSSAMGFIPTEWYPTALAARGDDLLIATGKAQGTGPNAAIIPLSDPRHRNGHAYIATLLHGSIARVKLAEAMEDLKALTSEVLESNLMNGRSGEILFSGGKNPIRHVIYVIKENRTYDQVFGDLGTGDGDPSLTMYGEAITPNQHKLARQFGVLDNFYDSGEVSGDGHVWSTAAITSDYTERVWQLNYRGHERTYDFEGGVGDDYPLQLGLPDVNEPGTGYLWTNAARHGLTYRHYGEFISTAWCDRVPPEESPPEGTPSAAAHVHCERSEVRKGEPLPANVGEPRGGPSPWPWPVPMIVRNTATKPELRGHFDPRYPDFRVEYPDQLRADEFLKEFAGFVAARQTGKGEQLPNLIVLRLPNDHTIGTRPGLCTPAACNADNDLAMGRVVEAVSHSPYWEDTAILVLEDDAQNGADHVDAHRSIALVISEYAPGRPDQPFVDHRFYTTVNMIRTLEALLGLPPMNNNDARAAVMAPLFSGPGNQPPFQADIRNRDNELIYQANPPMGQGASASLKMDFAHADSADTTMLNRILWREAKGDAPMPAPRHTVIPEPRRQKKDGGD
jgi:DNA-binding beta-propeller fold protein YncE